VKKRGKGEKADKAASQLVAVELARAWACASCCRVPEPPLGYSRIERGRLIAVPRRSSMKCEWKHVVCLGLLNLILVPSSSSFLQAQNKSQNKVGKEAAPMKLRVGDTAPNFTLLAFDGKELKKVSLQDYRGRKNVALAFFVFAFTGG
jgi:AhpC/TSA family